MSPIMRRDRALAILRQNESNLKAMGLTALSLFGSTARNDATAGSDVDIAVELDRSHGIDLFRFAEIDALLRSLLDRPVDLVTEPNRSNRLQATIDRDRVRVF